MKKRRRNRRYFRKRCGFGFFPCRGTIDGRAGDGKGESRRCRKPYFATNSAEFDDRVSVEFDDGTRRMAIVGESLREERIIVGGYLHSALVCICLRRSIPRASVAIRSADLVGSAASTLLLSKPPRH